MLITVTGWTYEYIDECMDFFRLGELMDYWDKNPPPHVRLTLLTKIVAALGGVKLPDDEGGATDASQVPPQALAGLGVKVEV